MASQNDVKLLSFWLSSFGVRCQIALAEKGVKYEYQEENILEEKSELLLKSNPVHKKVPVLFHHGKPICESIIILEYIDETFPGKASFLPSDPYARANARFWADFIGKKIQQEAFKLWIVSKGEDLDAAKKEFVGSLKLLEEELGEKKYFGGESIGIIDMALLPYTTWFYSFEVILELSVEKECPRIAAWGKRCLEKDSVAKSLPDPKKAHEFFVSRRNSRGIE